MDPIKHDQELLDLSKKVFTLTGWDAKYMYFWGDTPVAHGVKHATYENTPLLTADFLLDKLLPITSLKMASRKDGSVFIFRDPDAPFCVDFIAATARHALLEVTLKLHAAEDGEIVK